MNVRSIPMVVRLRYVRLRCMWDGFLRSLVESGRVSQAEVTRWLEDLEHADATGVFNQGVMVFTVCGQKS